jgi:hypothetical protein
MNTNGLYKFLATPGIKVNTYYVQVMRLCGFVGVSLRKIAFMVFARRAYVTKGARLKLYCFERRVSCKVRGSTLNDASSQLVNFNSIKDMIQNGERNGTVHTAKKD